MIATDLVRRAGVSAFPADKLPIVCGDSSDETWCLRVDGKERWFTPVIHGQHDGYIEEQPIVCVDGIDYCVGLCHATRRRARYDWTRAEIEGIKGFLRPCVACHVDGQSYNVKGKIHIDGNNPWVVLCSGKAERFAWSAVLQTLNDQLNRYPLPFSAD